MAEGAKNAADGAPRGSIARRILNRLSWPIIGRLAHRLDEIAEDRRTSYWAREALVDRMNRAEAVAEARWQHLLAVEEKAKAASVDRLAAIEVRVNELIWGRDALVERANFTDAREQVRTTNIEERIRALDAKLRSLEAHGIAELSDAHAAEIDALAISRRLASLEDHVERMLEQLGTEDSGNSTEAQSLVTFPHVSRKEAS